MQRFASLRMQTRPCAGKHWRASVEALNPRARPSGKSNSTLNSRCLRLAERLHCSGRPSAGGRLTNQCAQAGNTRTFRSLRLSPTASSGARTTQCQDQAALVRSELRSACSRVSIKSKARSPQLRSALWRAQRVLPNPSIEPTSTGWARYALCSFSASRAQPLPAAHVKR
jgi:hypothetical protein